MLICCSLFRAWIPITNMHMFTDDLKHKILQKHPKNSKLHKAIAEIVVVISMAEEKIEAKFGGTNTQRSNEPNAFGLSASIVGIVKEHRLPNEANKTEDDKIRELLAEYAKMEFNPVIDVQL